MADLVKVRYVGPHTEGVEIADQYCALGDTIEVSSEVADGLAGQDSWEVAGKKRAAAAKPKAKRAKKSPAAKATVEVATEDQTDGDSAEEQGA